MRAGGMSPRAYTSAPLARRKSEKVGDASRGSHLTTAWPSMGLHTLAKTTIGGGDILRPISAEFS